MKSEKPNGDVAILFLDGVPENLLQFCLVGHNLLRVGIVGAPEAVVPLPYLLVP